MVGGKKSEAQKNGKTILIRDTASLLRVFCTGIDDRATLKTRIKKRGSVNPNPVWLLKGQSFRRF